MDRRGRGRSGDGEDYSLDREIEDIKAVVDAAGPGASLLGHSSGAIYALEAAHRFPVERLVLYEPPLHFHGPEAERFHGRIKEAVESGRPEDAVTIFFSEEVGLDESQLAQVRATPLWGQMVALAWTFVREWESIFDFKLRVERYREMPVPTLLLYGSLTETHPSFATKALEETLPDARPARLDGQGHSANQMAPDLLAKVASSFLR